MATILLVSDNPLIRKLVRSGFAPDVHALLEASGARQAFDRLEHARPQLVLQDVVISGQPQHDLTSALRSRVGASVPLLGLTPAEEQARFASFFDDIVIKPVDPGRLAHLVEAHLCASGQAEARFGAGKRMLLVDAEPLQRRLLCLRMERLGFEVVAACDGRQALQRARRALPDLIVADVMLPGLDGFELTRALRRDCALGHVPVVLISASYVAASDRALARRVGARELCAYTPDLTGLVDTLRDTLERMAFALDAPARRNAHGRERALESEHERRIAHQLERQVARNAELSRRRSSSSAELHLLAGLSQSVLERRDLEPALAEALVACFDASGIAAGALYLLDARGGLRARALGSQCGFAPEELRECFGAEAWLRGAIRGRTPRLLSQGQTACALERELLSRIGADDLLVVPLVHLERELGALLIVRPCSGVEAEDLLAFGEGLGAQVVQVLALAAAFAEQGRARERAEQQAALLEALLSQAPDGVAHLDRAGQILFANPALRQSHTGFEVGGKWLDALPAEHAARARQALELVIASGESASYEISTRDAGAAPRWFSHRLGAVWRDGAISGAILVARDISERKQSEAQLLMTDRMASLGLLAANVAHEINNPLAAMAINLELMARELGQADATPLCARLAEELDGARESARRMLRVTRDLKIFSRAQETRTRVNVRAVLESSLRMAQSEIRQRARLRTEFGEVPLVDADEARLGQVFLNLLLNAAQAMAEGRVEHNELFVRTGTDAQGRALISIADTGAGIAPHDRAQLFRPFFTTKPPGVGTGLGLSICERIVRDLGGAIWFESELGRGSVFHVALPGSDRASRASLDGQVTCCGSPAGKSETNSASAASSFSLSLASNVILVL